MKIELSTRSVRLLGVVLLFSWACAGRSATTNAVSAWPTGGAVHVRVENHQGSPMTVYAVGSGSVLRIGRALPELPGDFEVPRAVTTDGMVEFVAEDSDGRSAVSSGRLQLVAGGFVRFNISTSGFATAWIGRR